jgi:hypothetical protein
VAETGIRKQVYELTAADFNAYPVWEFALDEEDVDGQDEATVRPWRGAEPIDAADAMFVVRAAIQLADGTRLPGYLTPGVQGDMEIGTIQPTILADAGQIRFWFGIRAPGADTIAKAYAALGRSAGDVFPCRYTSHVALVAGPVAGVLTGFLHYRSVKDRSIVEAT